MDRINSPFSASHKFRTKFKKQKLKKNALDKVDFEEEKRKDPKYKTELCKSYMENNFCQYGNKCRFAHGEEELVIKTKNVNYKRKLCKSFYKEGYCSYGIRCNYQHEQRKLSEITLSVHYINLIMFPKPKLFLGKRLKIFEDLTNIDNNLSESTISSSIENSPNVKKSEYYKENHQIDKNFNEICSEEYYKKLYFEIDLYINKKYKNENEEKDDKKINYEEDEINIEENYDFFLFNNIDIFDTDNKTNKQNKKNGE